MSYYYFKKLTIYYMGLEVFFNYIFNKMKIIVKIKLTRIQIIFFLKFLFY